MHQEPTRSSIADDLTVQPSGVPAAESSDPEAVSEPTPDAEPIPPQELPAASPLPNRRKPYTGGGWRSWLPGLMFLLTVVGIAASLAVEREQGRPASGTPDTQVHP